MKKFSTLILALMLALSLAACGGNGIDTDAAPSADPTFGGQPTAATDDLAVYRSVFDDLKNQIATEDYQWNGVQEGSGLGELTLANYRYLLRDMDSDGARELFLFTDESNYCVTDDTTYPYTLIAVFTITDEEPELLKEFWSRSRGYLTVGNYILNEWSDGADDSGIDFYWFADNKSFGPMSGRNIINLDSNPDPDYKVDESIEPLPIPGAATEQLTGDATLPRQKEITVTREGFKETFTATLVTSSRFNYSIYMLPDFEFLELDDGDYIRPIYEPGTVMPVNIGMKLYSADLSQELRDDIETDEENAAYVEYAYWELRDAVIQAEFTYIFEMTEGMAVLMRAMADTIQDAPASDTTESADDYVYESDDGWQITIPAAIKNSFEIETASEDLKDCFVNVTYGDITALCVSIVEVQSEDDVNSMDSVRTITIDGTQWAIGTTLDVSYTPDEGFDSTARQEYLTYRENLETFTDFQRAIIESFRATGE